MMSSGSKTTMKSRSSRLIETRRRNLLETCLSTTSMTTDMRCHPTRQRQSYRTQQDNQLLHLGRLIRVRGEAYVINRPKRHCPSCGETMQIARCIPGPGGVRELQTFERRVCGVAKTIERDPLDSGNACAVR